MTNEEAIKVLRTESIRLGGSVPSVCRFLDALDMAIAALMEPEGKDTYVPTNADRIRAMSDEELAQWMASRIANLKFLDIEISGKQLTATEKAALTHDLYVVFGRYLQQPAGEEDKHEGD